MNQAGYRIRGFYEFFAFIFLVAIAGLGVFCYQSIEALKQTPVAIASTAQAATYNSGELEALMREKGRLEGEVQALRSQRQQFESEKGVILNQVRASVKAFDDYRQQMSQDMNRLNSQIAQLQQENSNLRQVADSGRTADITERVRWEERLRQMEQENMVLKETVAVLQEEVEAKTDRRILMEAAKLHYNVGNFYFRNQQYEDAVAEYGKALMYQPNDPDIHYNLAVVSDEYLGDRPQALRHYKRYLSLSPHSQNARLVEEKILDMELYHTVLSSGNEPETRKKFRPFESSRRPETSHFYGG